MTTLTRLIILLALASLACGMTATIPPSDGRIGSWREVSTATAIVDTTHEVVFLVVVDSLHIRTATNQDAPSTGFLVRDMAVMGTCYKFDRNEDGIIEEIWLGFDRNPDGEPTLFAAVLFDGEAMMQGDCE